MRPCWSSLKREFLKQWIMGLRRCNSSKKHMSILERKNAIKISADVAMASARKGATCWSRALIASATQNDAIKHVVLGRKVSCNTTMRMRVRDKIVRRSCRIRRKIRRRKCGFVSAKKLVSKKTQVLKSLIPGGELMKDEVCLIEETLDYIMALRAQVDVMRSLATASELA